MSAPEIPPNRFDMPFASDDNLRTLFETARAWVTAHGHAYFEGEVYGVAPSPQDNTPTHYMFGTGPVSYRVALRQPTVARIAPDAHDLLTVTGNGMEITYDEPYYDSDRPDEEGDPSLVHPRTAFVVYPPSAGDLRARRRYSVLMLGDEVASAYACRNERLRAPDGSQHHELKVHEHFALSQVVAGLFLVTQKHRTRRRLEW